MRSHFTTNHLLNLHPKANSIPDAVSHFILFSQSYKNHTIPSFLFHNKACLFLVWLSVQSFPQQFFILFLYNAILIGYFFLFRLGNPLFSLAVSVTVDEL